MNQNKQTYSKSGYLFKGCPNKGKYLRKYQEKIWFMGFSLMTLQLYLMKSIKQTNLSQIKVRNSSLTSKQCDLGGSDLRKTKSRKIKKGSEDEEFELQYHTMKKLKLPLNRSKLKIGNWSLEENKTYLSFLLDNREDFVSQTIRRENRVFCRLSQLLKKKRTPDQCRSHHQKLLSPLHFDLQLLIDKLERKILEDENKQIRRSEGRSVSNGRTKNASSLGEIFLPPRDFRQVPMYMSDPIPEEPEQIQKIVEEKYTMTLVKKRREVRIEINENDIHSY